MSWSREGAKTRSGPRHAPLRRGQQATERRRVGGRRRGGFAAYGLALTRGPHVQAEEVEDDGEPFEEKMERLVGELARQFSEEQRINSEIRNALGSLGYAV